MQTVINEIGGEKIDIIEWQEEPTKFIAKALAPAKIIRVEIKGNKEKEKENDEKEDSAGEQSMRASREAVVYVTSDQLSLAIGKGGQNVRLAAKLTGWKIDIMEDKPAEEKKEAGAKEEQEEKEEK